MTLILEVSPEAEAQIRMKATARGQEITEYLVMLTENDQVIDLTEFEDQDDFDDSVAGIREGLADLEAGRTYSLEEASALLDQEIAAWQKARAHPPSQSAAPIL